MAIDTNIETLEAQPRLRGWDEPRVAGGHILESAALSTAIDEIDIIDDNPNIYKGWD